MRPALALLSIILFMSTMPVTAADEATFTKTETCLLAGAQLALGKLDGCTLTHEGTLAFVACDASSCSFDVAVSTMLVGAPVGAHEVVTRAEDGAGFSLVCSAEDVTLESSISCSGTRSVTIDFGFPCRFMSIQTDAAVNGRVAMSSIVTTFSVCLTESGADFEIDS